MNKVSATRTCGNVNDLIKVYSCLINSSYWGDDDARHKIYNRICRDVLTLIKLEAADIDPEGEIARVEAAMSGGTY